MRHRQGQRRGFGASRSARQPVPAVGERCGGRPRQPVRRRRRRRLWAAPVLALLAAGCGDPFDREAAVDSFAEVNEEASRPEAECVVDRLIERYGLDGLEAELAADPPAPEFEEAQFRDAFACGVAGDVSGQIVEQLQADGVGEEHAPCVADVLVAGMTDADIDVLLSGEITDAFYEKFVDAMEECGAINA